MKVKEIATKYLSKKEFFTYQDYLELPDDGNRYEIINGELIMTPAPIPIHQRISRIIGVQLSLFVEKYNWGEVFFSPCDVRLTETDLVQPDIFFIAKENEKIIGEKNIQGTPDLIIEILSPTTAYYDLIEKKELYEKFGVKEYWIVDPKKQWIEIYALENDKYKLHQRGEKTEKVHSLLLKGFEIELKDIFKME